ncbi:hypothetical protein pipiens_010329 [Culex pipiens pipiens]|uniref:SMB domain-containing protein n=1 Tax=Culex pipiens pipiens TaxID=38569 RepID=A0ABD1DAW5_CULPP
MCPTWWPTVALALVVVAGCVPGALGGSCREAALCCNGRDSSCVVQKAPLNAIIEDLNDKPCYCDHACLRLGDCCDDFKAHCGVKHPQLTRLIFQSHNFRRLQQIVMACPTNVTFVAETFSGDFQCRAFADCELARDLTCKLELAARLHHLWNCRSASCTGHEVPSGHGLEEGDQSCDPE